MGFPNMSSESDNIEVIAGRIAADGSITAGQGFSAGSPTDTSLYTITLDREYNSLISVVATAVAAGGDETINIDTVSSFPASAPGATIAFQGYAGDGTTKSATEFCFVAYLVRGDA